MKKWILLIPAILLSAITLAQNAPPMLSVKGIAIDSATNKPMPYVTVALQDAKTNKSVKSTLTNDDGSFVLKAPSVGPYNLVLAFIGYANKAVPVAGNGAEANLGKILLDPSTSQLKEVSITAVKPIMTQEVDRIGYNVQADPESTALSALDMMRKVPLLTVDGNDNVLLKGSGNYKILINGKESAMMAKNPSDVLKSMPASNIEKIEVITTPPAKYDAEGLAGIINIITKKNADQGYNVAINGRYNSVYGPGYNFNGSYKQGKLGVSGYFGFGNQKQTVTNSGTTENIFANQNTISQLSSNSRKSNYDYGDIELSYELDSLNLLTGSVSFYKQHTITGSNQTSNTDSAGVATQGYHLQNAGVEHYLGLDAALNYQLGFKRSKDELLTFSYQYNYSPDKQFNSNLFSERMNYPASTVPDYQQYNNSGSRTNTIQVDFTSPLGKKLTIEAGTKAILRNNFSDYTLDDRDSLSQLFEPNAGQTNNFNYRQDVYSLYNSYQLKLDKWTAKAGLRLEHTAINADFTSVGVSVAPDYNNLIPSISIQRRFTSSSFNLGYTQRIQRPGISQLNPFIDLSNPQFVTTGNPGLRPELDNTFEFSYSHFGTNSINAGVSYAFSNNSIQNVSSLRVDSLNNRKDTVTYTTYQNLGSNRTLGFNFNTHINISKPLSFGINLQVKHVWLKGMYNGQFYTNQGFTGNTFFNTRYKFDDGYAIGFNAAFITSDITLQGQSNDRFFSQYVVSKEFLNKKLVISVVANNPYAKYIDYRTTTNTVDFSQSSYSQSYYHTFAIRFNYKFGKLNSDIKKNQRSINNDDVKSGSKSSGGGN
jgi:hypothetical protein